MSERIIAGVEELRKEAPLLELSNKTVLIHNLIWMYQVIVASENLMELARDAAPEASRVFHKYMRTHLEEERNHAEWLAEDLSTAGVNVKRLPLNRSAVELVGSQYYLIHHVSPVAILGYMAVLEGFTFPLELLEQLEAIHGKEPLRCLRYHAENDIEHRKELFKVIDQLDDPIIYDNAIRTQLLMNEAFRAYPKQS
jgi:hypothetical protein